MGLAERARYDHDESLPHGAIIIHLDQRRGRGGGTYLMTDREEVKGLIQLAVGIANEPVVKERLLTQIQESAQHQAEEVTEKALERFMETLGFNPKDAHSKGEFVRDIQWVRSIRTGSAKGFFHILLVLGGVVSTGAMAWIWNKVGAK